MSHAIRTQLISFSIAAFFLLANSTLLAAPIGHAPWVGESFDGFPCQGQMENFGPFDYRQRYRLSDELGVVESYHFNANVENLVSGQTNTGPLPDLDYVLRAWPNHHRALNSVVRFRVSELNNNRRASRRHPPAECYLQRAVYFSPEDGTTLMLYGMLLQRTGQKNLALKKYRNSLLLEPGSIQIKYNLGLLLADLGEFTESNQYAQDVYSHGYPLPGLKNRLVKSGHWKETSAPPNSGRASEIQ